MDDFVAYVGNLLPSHQVFCSLSRTFPFTFTGSIVNSIIILLSGAYREVHEQEEIHVCLLTLHLYTEDNVQVVYQ